jgi:hypothetical protein
MHVRATLHFNALVGEPTLTPLYEAISEVEPEVFAQGVVDVLERDPTLVSAHLHRCTQTNEPGHSAILGQVLRALALRGASDVHQRVGIDLNPLDPQKSDDVDWLKACL